jgi:hypothetical protein
MALTLLLLLLLASAAAVDAMRWQLSQLLDGLWCKQGQHEAARAAGCHPHIMTH